MDRLIARGHGRLVVASVIGNTIEFYEFNTFGTMTALVFAHLFFPAASPVAGTLLAFGTFAVGFVSRPLGGALFGYLGDRFGRKPVMIWTLMVMGGATVLMGAIPTYDSIGIAAPVLLTVLRFVQGFGIGGEWGAAVTLVTEHAPAKRRGLYGSLVQTGSGFGLVLSSLTITVLLAVLTTDQLLAWGWRIPFLISVGLIGVGLWARLRIAESPEFERIKATGTRPRSPLWETVRHHPATVLLSIGIYTSVAAFGFLMVFVTSYAVSPLGFSRSMVIDALLVGNIVNLLAAPLGGLLSDRIGRRRSFVIVALCRVPLAFVFFAVLEARTAGALFLALILVNLFNGLAYGIQATLFTELFPARVRYTGISLGFQAATVLGGGLMPTIATLLLSANGGQPWGIAAYIAALCVVTVICVGLVRTRGFAGSSGAAETDPAVTEKQGS
ncbi:MFS transporter [Amycolatopsis sp. A1MSW2902]|uniref:MFS transporter n=1 Tax=Amycolatopsis sp. A1MSW2902 TaxID=687413 RepID=UPI00307ED7CF